MMQRGDTNRDGLLTIVKFLEMNTDELEIGSLATHLGSTFDALDVKGDGDAYMTREELYAIVSDMGVHLT